MTVILLIVAACLFAGLIWFLLRPPTRWRVFGPEQQEQALDHRSGVFWKTYASRAPDARTGKVGRNDPCPCGSGRKYKKCCRSAR